MEQVLLILGASIFGLLGVLHLIYTFFTNKFESRDARVTEAMKGASPIITKETSMWRAWIGFNISHSLGPIIFAGIYIPLTVTNFEVIASSIWLLLLPVLSGLAYLLLAKNYWFRVPFFGILVATSCFIGAAVLGHR